MSYFVPGISSQAPSPARCGICGEPLTLKSRTPVEVRVREDGRTVVSYDYDCAYHGSGGGQVRNFARLVPEAEPEVAWWDR
jgi:hypothetical protein